MCERCLGEWVRSRRAELLLTQEELATRAGISVRTIQSLETGAGTPRSATLRLLVDVLGPVPAAHAEGAPREVPGPAPVVPAQLPADVGAFTGRHRELADLDRLLETAANGGSTSLAIGVVSGGGGVGKTALVVRWAHRIRGSFPDGQLYVNLRGYDRQPPLAAGEVLTRFLNALGVSGPEVPADEDERATRYRTAIAGRRMLIVLDNAFSAEQVRPLVPGASSCVVVVTSRDSLSGLVSVHGARRIELDRLPIDDAVRLLHRLLGARVDADPAAAHALADQCARLPLALRLAADLATGRPAVTLAGLVAELADQQRRLDLLGADGDTRAAVRAVFSWSYAHLPRDTARGFRLIGLHPGPDLDAYAMAALLDTDLERARRLLEVLARAHLTEPSGSGRHGVHDLLRTYAAELATSRDPEPERQAALTRLCDYYLAAAAAAMDAVFPAEAQHRPRIPPPGTPVPPVTDQAEAQTWLDGHRLTLAAVCVHTARHGWPRHTVRLAHTLHRYLANGGHYTQILATHGEALAAARQLGDRGAQAHTLSSLASANIWLNQYSQAVAQLTEAWRILRDLADPYGQARALGNLGVACYQLGEYGRSADYYQQALVLFRDIGDQVGEARALGNLGDVYIQQGRYGSATELCRQALALHRVIGERAGEVGALGNLGVAHARQGQLEPALECQQQALDLSRELGNRAGQAEALTALGDINTAVGRHSLAHDQHQRALTIFEEIGSHDGRARALSGLGEACRAAGRPDDAIIHHTHALGIATELGDRASQARANAGLGHAYRALGKPAEARRHWEAAVTGYAELGSPLAGEVAANLSAEPSGDGAR
jgi:tetratricopeptide (TPR) repeat protein/transcriptional regulator with XRE-family HTH domain